jgi:Flp pilus assembly protein TadG
MSMKLSLAKLASDDEGLAAVEFALVASVFFTMLFGAVASSIMGYSVTSMNSAVESAARCRAMGTTCTDKATTEAYALTKFHSVSGQNPTFSFDGLQTCGYQVSATLNYNFNWIAKSSTIPFTAKACFG